MEFERRGGGLTLDGTGTETVDALDLVGADDQVLQGGAVLQLEDSVLGAALGLTGALDATAVGLHATVEGARDNLGLGVGDRALGRGDVEAVGALDDLRRRSGRGSNGESAEEGGGDEVEGRHGYCLLSMVRYPVNGFVNEWQEKEKTS